MDSPQSQIFAVVNTSADEPTLRRYVNEIGVGSASTNTTAVDRLARRWLYTALACGAGFVASLLVAAYVASEGMIAMFSLGSIMIGADALHKWQLLRKHVEQLRAADETNWQAFVCSAIGPWRFEFSEYGVRCIAAHTDAVFAWTTFWRVVPTDSFLSLHTDRGVIGIPRSSFATPAEMASLVVAINERLEKHGAIEVQRLRKYLGHRSLACQACGYDLRGCNGRLCSECGSPVRIEDYPDARLPISPPNTASSQ